MDNKMMDKAMDIFSELIAGGEISSKVNADLYEAYLTNAAVADFVDAMLKKCHLKLYAYNDALYMTSGEKNRVFGFSNDELKKVIGLRLNKELFLAYFMIFETVTLFYKDSGTFAYIDYVRAEDVINKISATLSAIVPRLEVLTKNDTENYSFKSIALLWEDMPMTTGNEDTNTLKAARGSRTGFVKLVFNFLIEQNLFYETGGRYYAKDRFRALVENYYEDGRGRLYEIVSESQKGGVNDAAY